MPYVKCVDQDETKYILEEIHEGVCGDHVSPRSLVSKVIRTGYFWPTMQADAIKLVKQCDKCQRFGNVQRLPAEKLTAIASPLELVKRCDKCQRFGNVQRLPAEKLMAKTSPWPFSQWGIDIVCPLPQGKGRVKFLLVAIDYFTKWVKAEALSTITEARIQSFVWKNIICRFGIPLTIISDNGR